MRKALILWCIMLNGVFGSCSRPSDQDIEKATDPVLEERSRKNRAFKFDRDSPIPEKDRGEFEGLAYFPLDASLRFTVKLNRYPRPQRFRLGTNTGEMRDALRYGYFEFDLEGRKHRLQVYRMEEVQSPDAPYLFIPFRDATSGKETYAGGRYIDLRENTVGRYLLDFNRAYNPLCAYSKGYSCPMPPEENRLSASIRAGEKTYPIR